MTTALPPPPAAAEEDITTSLYRAAIGPVGAGYYLPIFTRFEEADHAGITWNTTAAVFTLHWLLFRQLYLYALAYVGAVLTVVLLVFGIGRVLFQFPDALLIALGVGFGAMAVALPGLFGNILLHTECRKRMAAAVAANHNMADARAALQAQASTRQRGIILAAVQALLVLVGALIYWQVSALTPSEQPATGDVAPPIHRLEPAAAASTPASQATSTPLPLQAASQAALPASAPASEPTAAASAAASPSSAASSALPATSAAQPASVPVSAVAVASAATPASAAVSAVSAPVRAPSTPSAPLASRPAATTALPASTPANATPVASQAKAPLPIASKPAEKDKARQRKALQTALNGGDTPSGVPSKSAKPQPEPKPKVKPTTKAQSNAKPTSPAADAAGKPYYINVGLFAVSDNADRAQAKLQAAQLPVVSKTLKSKNGPLTRVRVGPFNNELEAKAASEKIKGLQLDAVVVQP